MSAADDLLWQPGDRCITPKGELAIVMSVQGVFLTLRYRDAMPGSSAAEEFQLNGKLCAKYGAGHRPAPVVVGDAQEVAHRSRTLKRSRW